MFEWYANDAASPECSVVLKQDDDTFVHPRNLINFLKHHAKAPLFHGWRWKTPHVIRDKAHKSYVPRSVYKPDRFPSYLSGGAGYLISWDLVPVLAACPLYERMLREDATVSGRRRRRAAAAHGRRRPRAQTGLCLLEYGIKPVHDPRFRTTKACTNGIVTSHYMKARDMRECWAKIGTSASRV